MRWNRRRQRRTGGSSVTVHLVPARLFHLPLDMSDVSDINIFPNELPEPSIVPIQTGSPLPTMAHCLATRNSLPAIAATPAQPRAVTPPSPPPRAAHPPQIKPLHPHPQRLLRLVVRRNSTSCPAVSPFPSPPSLPPSLAFFAAHILRPHLHWCIAGVLILLQARRRHRPLPRCSKPDSKRNPASLPLESLI